jgi:GDP-L-fucose synthase
VAGASTLLGRQIAAELVARGFTAVVAAPEPDLGDRAAVEAFFLAHRPEYVFVPAGRSAGIKGNLRAPAELVHDNLGVVLHVLHAAHLSGVRKLLYFASSCVYPKAAAQPLREASLHTGPLEPTSEPYAVSKLAGLAMCAAYRKQYGDRFVGVIPGDMFGPGDHFDEDAHVVGSLLRRMHEAKAAGAREVVVWGSGTPRRDFVYARDVARAAIVLMERYDGDGPVNAGSGGSRTIRELAEAIREVVGFDGALRFDTDQPDGAPLKALDSTILHELGWRPGTPFLEALRETYSWFVEGQEGQ